MTKNMARLDRVVLGAADPVAAAGFHERTLGLEPLRLADLTAGKVSLPSVRVSEETILDLAPYTLAERKRASPGAAGHPMDHICLCLPSDAFDALSGCLAEHAVP